MNSIMTQPAARSAYLGVVAVTLALLAIPLIAMQFTGEVNWTLGDFVIMGALLLATGFIAVTSYLRLPSRIRVYAVVAVIALFLWIWAELAVGVFTNIGS